MISGSALVTVLESPTASFTAQPDSMTILYTTTQLVDKSEGNIINWQWDFGDGDFSTINNPSGIVSNHFGLILGNREDCPATGKINVFINL